MSIHELIVWLLCLVIAGLVVNRLRKGAQSGPADKEPAFTASHRDLFESAPIGYVEVDRKGIIQRVNRRQCKLLGLDQLGSDQQALIGKPCTELVPPPERERFADQLNRKLAGETALAAHLRDFVRPNGSTVTVEVHEHLIEDASGHVRGMRLAALDVSDRKHSEEQAYHAASALQALFQAFPDLFLRVDREGNVLDAKGGQSSDPFLACAHFSGRKLGEILPAEAM